MLQIKIVNYIVTPVGGDKQLLKKLFFIESFIRDLFKNADSSSNKTSVVFMSESLNNLFKPMF